MGFRNRFRTPGAWLAVFVLLGAIPLVALSWLAWRLLEQDRALEAQRVRERLDNAAVLASRELGRSLDVWSSLPARVSDGATLSPFRAIPCLSSSTRTAYVGLRVFGFRITRKVSFDRWPDGRAPGQRRSDRVSRTRSDESRRILSRARHDEGSRCTRRRAAPSRQGAAKTAAHYGRSHCLRGIGGARRDANCGRACRTGGASRAIHAAHRRRTGPGRRRRSRTADGRPPR